MNSFPELPCEDLRWGAAGGGGTLSPVHLAEAGGAHCPIAKGPRVPSRHCAPAPAARMGHLLPARPRPLQGPPRPLGTSRERPGAPPTPGSTLIPTRSPGSSGRSQGCGGREGDGGRCPPSAPVGGARVVSGRCAWRPRTPAPRSMVALTPLRAAGTPGRPARALARAKSARPGQGWAGAGAGLGPGRPGRAWGSLSDTASDPKGRRAAAAILGDRWRTKAAGSQGRMHPEAAAGRGPLWQWGCLPCAEALQGGGLTRERQRQRRAGRALSGTFLLPQLPAAPGPALPRAVTAAREGPGLLLDEWAPLTQTHRSWSPLAGGGDSLHPGGPRADLHARDAPVHAIPVVQLRTGRQTQAQRSVHQAGGGQQWAA